MSSPSLYTNIPQDNSPSSLALAKCLDLILENSTDKARSMIERKEVDMVKHGNKILIVACSSQDIKLIDYILSFNSVDPSLDNYHAFKASLSSPLSPPEYKTEKVWDLLFSKLGIKSENACVLPDCATYKRYDLIKNVLSFCPKNDEVDECIIITAYFSSLSNDFNSTKLLVSHLYDIKKTLSNINKIIKQHPTPQLKSFAKECISHMIDMDKKALNSNIKASNERGIIRKYKKI